MTISIARPIVLITGANTGIGAGVTQYLHAKGYSIFGTYYSHQERAHSLMHKLDSDTQRVMMTFADFADPNYDYAQLIETVIAQLGDLHAIVHCAAEVRTIPFRTMRPADWDRTLCINLRAPLFISQAAFYAYQQQQCHLSAIVNISSISDRYVWHGPAYEASKAGLSMITRSLGLELAPFRIRVNAVAPGTVASERNLADDTWNREEVGRVIPIQRPGEVDDIASVVHFLLSDAANYVIGQVIYVDGGLSLRV